MNAVEFDIEGFACALDGIRFKKRMTWRDIARAAKVSPATVCRIANRKYPDANTLTRLIYWSGLKFEAFIVITETKGQL